MNLEAAIIIRVEPLDRLSNFLSDVTTYPVTNPLDLFSVPIEGLHRVSVRLAHLRVFGKPRSKRRKCRGLPELSPSAPKLMRS